ncbi:MAG: glycosyltransferase family 9 protein [Ignavibacterium sp.]|nr:MAG: glycosyltransferase family 9 protein [Ignavibacterium sp.]
MKILIISLSGIGDALMFTPALRLLRVEMPDATIDALVMFKGAADLYKNNPNLNNVYQFDFINEGKVKSLKYLFGLRGNYDTTINVYPSNRKEYNFINFLLGADQRAGVKYLRRDFRNLGFLNNVRVTENDNHHNVKTNINLVEALLSKSFKDEPRMRIYLSDDDTKAATVFLSSKGINTNDLIIGFHPGCATLKNHIKRRWEPEKFAELGRGLIEKHNAKILLFGGADEDELKNKIKNNIDSANAFVVNADSILESAAIMNCCTVFVTNDSSQMHIAAALGLKTVAIIGPTNQHYIHPWKTDHKIVSLNLDCAPCFFYSPRPLICNRDDVKFKCIKELTADMVFDEVKQFI